MKRIKVDIPFLISIIILVIAGYLIFSSASLGLLSTQTIKYANVAFNQTFFGLFLGILACIFTSQINYKIYRKYSLFIFLISIIITLLVFIPTVGVIHGGASRWISFGQLSFQPSEFLKIGFIIFLSAWIARVKEKNQTFKYGFLP
ncbi:MAG: FtsW/RodA/SpoVE family cell cycle protein, partial [Candidatus Zambryskibacteria bacterium]|nr:FtsW/RodA/SpoVE family cell cycle protein [Candidatus Zambryskibacteria bacterium]